MPSPPTYPGVYTEEVPLGACTITAAPTSITALIGVAGDGPMHTPVKVTSFTEFVRQYGALASPFELGFAVRAFFGNGGKQALIVRVGKSSPGGPAIVLTGSRTDKTGFYALEKTEQFNLLCLTSTVAGADVPLEVYQEAMAYCQERRAMLLMDAPTEWGTSPTGTVDHIVDRFEQSGLTRAVGGKNAMIYFPRILVDDPLGSGGPRTIGPCGAAAGILTRIDETRGVWKAPAGTDATLVGVRELQVQLTGEDYGLLSRRGINCFRKLSDGGFVVWGARTLEGADTLVSEWKYVPVRRCALFLESSIAEGLKWVAFEPNEEPTWAKIRSSARGFLNSLFRQGAFLGQKPSEAFFVKCDQETTTNADVVQGILNVLIGFAPLKPAEFVIIRIQLKTGGRKDGAIA